MRAGGWPLKGVPLAMVLAVSAMLPLAQPGPPRGWMLALWLGLAVCGVLRPRTRRLVLLIMPALLCQALIMSRLHDRLPARLASQVLTLTGTIASLPTNHDEMTEFLFQPEPRVQAGSPLPRLIRVRWYEDAPALAAGQSWLLDLRLQPPRGRTNFVGADHERRYFARGIGALGTVVSGKQLEAGPGAFWTVHRWRGVIRQRLAAILADEPAFGLVLALAIGDRSYMNSSQWQILTLTGTGHLLAISGLHVGFAAVLGFRFGWLSHWLLPLRWRLRLGLLPAWCGAGLASTAYAAMAGFSVSTQRALVMLLVLTAARLSRRNLGPFLSWALALMTVLLVEPFAPLQPGFWMSFTAVAILLWQFAPRIGQDGLVLKALRAQTAILLAMFPLGVFWFQRASLLSLPANFLAIPAVSLVVVPLVLGGLVLLSMDLPGLAAGLLLPAAWAIQGLMQALAWLASGAEWLSWTTRAPSLIPALLATAALLLALWPGVLRLRLICLALLCPLLWARPAKIPPAAVDLHLLDIGQGLAAMIETSRQLSLYDTGPGQPGRWDLVAEVIEPAVRQTNFGTLDRILVSHGDLDHAGGLGSLRTAFPRAGLWVNSRRNEPGAQACNVSASWQDGPVNAHIMHPTPWLPYLGNLSSCVLSLKAPAGSILLPGDIDQVVERRLLMQGLSRHDVLVAPHHGSRTSSSAEFVQSVGAQWVLVPAGAGNRFGFPHSDVLARYRGSGSQIAAVSDCGAIRAQLRPGQTPVLRSARRVRNAVWRWPAAVDCP